MSEEDNSKLKWSSKLEFYVSLIGYSIGMPEFWRVPYLTFRNGGGTFIFVYMLLMFVCGLPIYFLEIALSQYSGKGPWKIWDICPVFRGIGLGIAVINGIYAINTAMLEVWSFEYFVNSFQPVLPWTTCNNSWNTESCFIDQFLSKNASQDFNATGTSIQQPVDAVDEFWLYRVLRISESFGEFGTISGMFVLYLFVMRLIAGVSMVKSVQSIGKLLIVTALLPVLLIIVIWIKALTLPGSLQGMKEFITPDWSRFLDSQLWIEASFQTFITLGPGWGGLMMFGCHNKFHTNSLRASLVAVSSTFAFGLFNGFVVYSVIGVMSAELNVPLDSVLMSGGFSISFIAYPKALSYFPFPQIWCVLFYLVMLMPGLDAMTILTEPFLLVIEEMFPRRFGKKRLPLLIIFSVAAFVFGIPFASQSGVYIFLLIDWYLGTWSVMLICLAECIAFCWIYGGHRIDRDLRLMLGRGLPTAIRIASAFIMPIFMMILLIVSIFTYRPPTFGKYSFPDYALSIGWCFTSLSIIPCILFTFWLLTRTKGTFRERVRALLSVNKHWYPADKEACLIYRRTEKCAKMSFKQICIFNLTGRGQINIERAKDTNDIQLMS